MYITFKENIYDFNNSEIIFKKDEIYYIDRKCYDNMNIDPVTIYKNGSGYVVSRNIIKNFSKIINN